MSLTRFKLFGLLLVCAICLLVMSLFSLIFPSKMGYFVLMINKAVHDEYEKRGDIDDLLGA